MYLSALEKRRENKETSELMPTHKKLSRGNWLKKGINNRPVSFNIRMKEGFFDVWGELS